MYISALPCPVIHHHFAAHFDNRDFEILPNYQPKASQGLNEQTLLFGKPEGVRRARLFYYFFLLFAELYNLLRVNGYRVS